VTNSLPNRYSAWPRIAALFAILCSIKFALIFKLAPHLYQTHWRVAGYELTTLGQVAFYAFVALVAAHLLLLARDCRFAGIKAVRVANGGIVGIGLVFLFLTFHNGANNYLFPIFNGILQWSSLGPYLSLEFCFQQPFLALWVFGYALMYYILTRTRRETWTIYFTIGAATLYALWHLRDLALYQNELLVIDLIGCVCLAVAMFVKKPMPIVLAAMPVLWTLCFAGLLLWQFRAAIGLSTIYFVGLVLATVLLFGVFTVLLRRRGAVPAWSVQSIFFAAAFLLLTNTNYPLAQNYNQALWLGFEFPRYFLGQALLTLALFFCSGFQRRLFPKLGLLWLDVAGVLLIAIALIDFRITGLLGVRLDWSVLALGDSPKMMWRMARPYVPLLLLVVAFFVSLYSFLVRALNRGRQPELDRHVNVAGWWYAASLFFVLALLGSWNSLPDKARGEASFHLASSSPWWKKLTRHTMPPQQFFETAKALGVTFDAPASLVKSGPPRDLNVLLVFMESTYNQHLSLFGAEPETQPLLSHYKDRMELFPNFFSSFASSIHARFASFTSLYPVQDYNAFTADHVPVKSIFEVLHEQGYDCSMFYSSFADFTGFRDFLRGRAVELHDADNMPGQRSTPRVSWGLREEETLAAMRGQIQKYAGGGKKFFLTYVPAAPHYPYDAVPDRFRKFKPGDSNDYTPLYLNELLYMDWVLASLVDQLRDSGLLDKTLVVITDDHGEMTGGKDGPIGHGWWLTPELANAPLILMDPDKKDYCVNTTVGSQVDLLPTLCDRLRIPLPEGQLYQGRSLDRPNPTANRLSWLNSFQQYAVIEGNRLIFGDREKETHGKAASGLAYAITNSGSKTTFQCDSAQAALPASIHRFDEFQQALLRNYAEYARAAAARPRPAGTGVTMRD
jgi:phosphoglycerol transferase MdoB-like AlkP superfamily enzyme